LNLIEAARPKAAKTPASAAQPRAARPKAESEQPNLLSTLTLPVQMQLANEQKFSHTRQINFIDNRVNATTGTIRMRGVFPNPDGRLKAGLFVRIRLPISPPHQAILIPDEALMSDQGRKYVYLLNDKKEVVYRAVSVGQEIETLR